MEKPYFLSGGFLPVVVEKVGVCRREGGIGCCFSVAFIVIAGESVCHTHKKYQGQ